HFGGFHAFAVCTVATLGHYFQTPSPSIPTSAFYRQLLLANHWCFRAFCRFCSWVTRLLHPDSIRLRRGTGSTGRPITNACARTCGHSTTLCGTSRDISHCRNPFDESRRTTRCHGGYGGGSHTTCPGPSVLGGRYRNAYFSCRFFCGRRNWWVDCWGSTHWH